MNKQKPEWQESFRNIWEGANVGPTLSTRTVDLMVACIQGFL